MNIATCFGLLMPGITGQSITGRECKLELPPPVTAGGMPLMQALQLRRSCREFSPDPLPLQVLSDLLWAAQGVNRPDSGKRTAPTARDWREIDIYVATAEGVYLYEPDRHGLRRILDGDMRALTGTQDFPATVPVDLIYVADLSRVDISDEHRLLAARTPGFVGADLANVINEAALLAARRDKRAVDMDDFEEAINRVLAGLEKKRRVMSRHEQEVIAYHESGHALVAETLPHTDRVHRISIIPRGIAALGYTLQLPTQDRYLMTRTEMLEQLTVLLAGRAAEELVFDEVSTGAQDDLERATHMARSMVAAYGMSEMLGPMTYGAGKRPQFLETPCPSPAMRPPRRPCGRSIRKCVPCSAWPEAGRARSWKRNARFLTASPTYCSRRKPSKARSSGS